MTSSSAGLRVCFPVWEFHENGGIERSVTELVRCFLNDGHRVEILTFRNRSSLNHPLLTVRELRFPKAPFAHRPVRSLVEIPTFVLGNTITIARSRRRWDAVINYGVGQTMAPALLVATSCHLAWMRERRRVLGKGLGSPVNAFILGVERYNYRRSANAPMIAVSHQVAEQLEELYGVNRKQIRVVYPGVDVDQFAPGDAQALRRSLGSHHGIPTHDVWIVFCGYEYHRKGLDVLLRALGSSPDSRTRVIVVGDDPVARPQMLAMARQLGVASRVHFLGNQTQVLPWFQAADVFVLPTRMDAFGMVVLEAMACGIPAITTAAAGVSELIASWENGYVMSAPENADELAVVLTRLASDPTLRARMGEAARRTALRCTWKEHARQILQILMDQPGLESPSS